MERNFAFIDLDSLPDSTVAGAYLRGDGMSYVQSATTIQDDNFAVTSITQQQAQVTNLSGITHTRGSTDSEISSQYGEITIRVPAAGFVATSEIIGRPIIPTLEK